MVRSAVSVLLLIGLVAACQGPSPSGQSPAPASPTATPAASATASPVASAPVTTPGATPTSTQGSTVSYWSQNPPEPLLGGSAVRIVVAELNIRAAPTTSAKRLATIRADHIILVRDLIPPVEADGYVWYNGVGPLGDGKGALLPLPDPADAAHEVTEGWFAARRGSNVYVEPAAARCPTIADAGLLGAMTPAERLACFGGRSIQFEARFRPGCPECEIFGRFEPSWLGSPNELNFALALDSGFGIDLRFAPGSSRPDAGLIIRVQGHFDDAAAATCTMELVPLGRSDVAPDPVPSSVARLWCRHKFVVERYDVLGPDPSYDPDEPFG